MKKNLLILVLCSPLGWVAWQECRRLLADWYSPLVFEELEVAAPSATEKAKRETAKSRASEVLKLSPELVRSAVTLDEPTEANDPGPVAKAVVDFGRVRQKDRKRVNDELDKASTLIEKIEQELAQRRGEDGRPREASHNASPSTLDNFLNDYKNLDVYVPDLLASAEAEGGWPELERVHPRRKLDELYDQIDRWTPTRAELGILPVNAARDHALAYRAYLDKFAKVRGPHAAALVREANERHELWARGAGLIAEINQVSSRSSAQPSPPPAAGDAAWVRGVAELASTGTPPAKFVTTARRLARALCARLLPEEKLDEMVLVNDGGTPRQVSRAMLGIVWNDRGTTVLEKSRYNEFNLKFDEVKGFVFNNEGLGLPEDGTPALSPTDYSKAVHAYNDARAQVTRWSVEDVSRLRGVCEQHRSELERGLSDGGKTLLARIDAVLEVVRSYPALFSHDSE